MKIVNLRVSQIEPDKTQLRKYFDQSSLIDLSVSIAENGIIEPIVVKPIGNGFYKIIAGERRWRASRMANLCEIPTIIMEDISDLDAFKLSFSENLQRQSLTPIEEAIGYVKLQEDFGLTQLEIANTMGKSRSSVANSIRLLKLSQPIQDMISNGSLTVAHAKSILSTDEKYHEYLARLVVDNDLSLKQLNLEIKRLKPKTKSINRCSKYFKEVEISLISTINRPVKISGTEKCGTISIQFYGKEDLNSLANDITKLLENT